MEIVPSVIPRPSQTLGPDKLVLSTTASSKGYGQRITVVAPMSDQELHSLMEAYRGVRVVHLSQPSRLLSGFTKMETQAQFDVEIQKRVTYWCCRSPPDMRAKNLTEGIQLVALPPTRWDILPQLDTRFSYLHKTPPLPASMLGPD
jgi:hypothetical protein